MNENVSPNPIITRKLRQSKLVFSDNNKIILDSNPFNTKLKSKIYSNKKLKKESKGEDKPIDKRRCCQSMANWLKRSESPIPEVDPRLNDKNGSPEVDDNSNDSIEVISDSRDNVLPLEVETALMEDCSDNEPIVMALKTKDELKEDCVSLDLVFNPNPCDADSEAEPEPSTGTEPTFEVESIYDSKTEPIDGLIYYLVKWKNYSEKHNTWEPLRNLSNCRQLLAEFKHIRNNCGDNQMDIYHNYYRLKGIIEDVVERKIPFDVMTALLLIFNDYRLKDFNYTKASVKKMRSDLRDNYLLKMDNISKIKNIENRMNRMTVRFNQFIEELNIKKRFVTFDLFFDFFVKRKRLEFRLNRWENDVNIIIDQQNEGQPIKLENLVDCEVPPHNFEYISKCKTLDPNVVINEEPAVYCCCGDCETQSPECCVASNQVSIPYTKNGILKDSRNYRNPIYECNLKCKCTQNCINRVVQKGRKHKLAIFRTDDDKGWGVRALEPISKGSYVMEYVGEIITVEEADKRGQVYDAEGRTYLFDLDYTPDEIAKYTLDATQCGNVSHFVNHSCDPNLDTRVVWINNLDPFMPHIALFAVRNIKLNEELTFDYKISVHGITDADKSQELNQSMSSDLSFDSVIDGSTSEHKVVRVSCRCGAYNCREYLY